MKTTSILLGGVAAAIIGSVLTVVQFELHEAVAVINCLSYISCGLIAVWHYTTRRRVTLSASQAVKMGALSGLVAAAVRALGQYLLLGAGVIPSKEEVLTESMSTAGAAGWIDFIYGIGGILIIFAVAVTMGVAGAAIGRAIWKKGSSAAT